MNDSEFLMIGIAIGMVAGSVVGWKIRDSKVKSLRQELEHGAYQRRQLSEQANETIQGLRADVRSAAADVTSTKERLQLAKNHQADLQRKLDEARASNERLRETYATTIADIHQQGALLPSLVEWARAVQESLDREICSMLVTKDRPALKAANEVKEARALARQFKSQADSLRNQVALYEAQAPWLVETVEYTVAEVLEGLRQEAELQKAAVSGDDPTRLFVSISEWNQLSEAERDQLALDRYWEYRQKNAWAAGIQYERFVGYTYEKNGYTVDYQGATKGVEDLGIDLVCRRGDITHLVQCKRLSPTKALPVRENTVAQIYGAALVWAHMHGADFSKVMPVIVTTYILSTEARQFADVLRVKCREEMALERYPCVKCNISGGSREKIYHLPFDQQYDVTRVEPEKGEIYAMTVADAEKRGFRRAFRWRGL